MLWILELTDILSKGLDRCPLCGHDFHKVAEEPDTYKCRNCGLMAIDNQTEYNNEEELRLRFGPHWVKME